MIATARYGLNENQVYGATAALLILSGILFRRFRPVMVRREGESVGWDVDWFHILVIFVLIPMAWGGRPRMAVRVYSFDSSVCTSVCSAGTLEKGGVYAGSSSGSSGILAPAVYPVAGDAKPGDTADSGCWFYLESGPHMGDRKEITNLQTVLYCLCLGAMASGCLSTGAVWDALILEGCQSGCVPPGAYEKM